MLSNFNKLFPVWAVLLSLLAFYSSAFFSRFDGAIVPLLSAVMFIMGLTLSREDFIRIAKSPRAVLVGLVLQFLLMPLLAILLATILQLSNQLTIGMILVGACAGGTASNVICYLAKGDVALSISMTMASTLVGVVATPFLSSFYLAATISVDPLDMFISILQMVLLPVIAGTVLNGLLHSAIARFEPVLPSLSVVLILLIIAIVVALNADRLTEVGLITLLAVVLHNLGGLSGGYYISRLLGFDIRQSQTIAIEVGMQNSGLGVALALQFFSATAALPGALFSVWHNVSGSILASVWSSRRSSLEYIVKEEESQTQNKKNKS